MHIEVEPRDSYAILHLRGEFDTYYVPAFQEEVESLTKAGVVHIVLNLRLVKFINSTALGGLIKASKVLTANGGQLMISRPSRFCKDIIEKVGLDRVIPVHETDEAAASAFGLDSPEPQNEANFEVDKSSVIFSPIDLSRVEHFITEEERGGAQTNPVHGHSFGGRWSGIGRMANLDENGLALTWSGGTSGLSPFEMGQLLAIGTQWKLKFRLPLLKKGYCDATGTATEVEERTDGVKVSFQFSEIADDTREAVKQYSADMAYLKDELREATEADCTPTRKPPRAWGAGRGPATPLLVLSLRSAPRQDFLLEPLGDSIPAHVLHSLLTGPNSPTPALDGRTRSLHQARLPRFRIPGLEQQAALVVGDELCQARTIRREHGKPASHRARDLAAEDVVGRGRYGEQCATPHQPRQFIRLRAREEVDPRGHPQAVDTSTQGELTRPLTSEHEVPVQALPHGLCERIYEDFDPATCIQAPDVEQDPTEDTVGWQPTREQARAEL